MLRCLLALMMVLLPAASAAQPAVPIGRRVRLTTSMLLDDGGRRVDSTRVTVVMGTLRGREADSWLVEVDGRALRAPVAGVTKVEISRGQRANLTPVWVGLVGGGAAGMLLGAVAGVHDSTYSVRRCVHPDFLFGCNRYTTEVRHRPVVNRAWVIAGGVVGSAVGVAIGAARAVRGARERWGTVPLGAARLDLLGLGAGEIRLTAPIP